MSLQRKNPHAAPASAPIAIPVNVSRIMGQHPFIDATKIIRAAYLRQWNKLGTLKKMNPRESGPEGSGLGLWTQPPIGRVNVAPEGYLKPSKPEIQSPPHVRPGFAGFTYEIRSRGGITPTGQVVDTQACRNYAYECQSTGIVPQSPEMVKSTGRRLATDIRQRSYTPHVSPQTVLPQAGRDNGERAFVLKDLTDGQ